MAISAVIQEEGGKQKITLDGIVITDSVLLEQKTSGICGYDLILRVSVDKIAQGNLGGWIISGSIPPEAFTGGALQKTRSHSPCYPEERSP